jgi:hypothetical protein
MSFLIIDDTFALNINHIDRFSIIRENVSHKVVACPIDDVEYLIKKFDHLEDAKDYLKCISRKI